MPSETSRLAVLIDADNTSPRHAGAVLREVARYGLPTVKRAYGDWTTQNLVGWKNTLPQHAIQPVQQFANTSGKNSTDSAMIIDAMDLLYAGHLDGFAIVSSDSDFTRLATRLRESGLTVYGLGERKTPASLVAACDRFIYLELLTSDAKDEEPSDEPDADVESPPRRPDLRRILVAAIDNTSHEDGWAALGAVGSYISANNPSFDARDYGSPRLGALLSAQDYLDVDLSATGQARVRLRATKPATKKASTRKAATKKA
ncbi:NYN domain-containing protein [Nocardioides lijunqiniae]|uniref:NYN domain-containing protein n=1 Tax=Nocardioides lijunqiniae TaxID=2760832 RepID=UPI0018789689|nr:NYN domain-containing protein [Nocardioides lijunqiniae]